MSLFRCLLFSDVCDTMSTTIKDAYSTLMMNESFLQKILVYMVNNRIQEFTDPLTSTLVLLATSPLQLVFCESGLILFKTSLLPVFPYSCLNAETKSFFHQWVCASQDDHESSDSSGQFTLTISLNPKLPSIFVCKRALLSTFVYVMRNHNGTFNDPAVCCTLCNIILQRFMAVVPVPSDIVSSVMAQLSLPSLPPLCPLLTQPSDVHFVAENSNKRKRGSKN